MTKTVKNYYKWKRILVVDDNKIVTHNFELDKDEKLINLISRQKKRKSLYKNIHIKTEDIMYARKKPNLVFVQHQIFTLSNISDDDNNNKDDYSFNQQQNLITTDLVRKIEMNQDKNEEEGHNNSFFTNYFTESDSENMNIPSDFEL